MWQENSSPDFTRYPLLWLAVCFAAGILAGWLIEPKWPLPGALLLATAAAALLLRRRKAALLFLLGAFLAAGALVYGLENGDLPAHRLKRIYDEKRIGSGEPVELEGVVRGGAETAAGGFFLELHAERLRYRGSERAASGVVRLFAAVSGAEASAEYERLDLRRGVRLRVAVVLEREERFLNPGVPDAKALLDERGIDAAGAIKSPLLVERIGEQRAFLDASTLYAWRQILIEEFRARFSVATAGVMIASLLGNKHYLDRETAELFREGGIFHVLVISGLHVTFIGGLVLLLLGFLRRRRIWQFLLASAFLWAFTLAVGAEIPVLRATIMFTMLLFSQVVRREGTLLNALGAGALVLLVWRPQDLLTASFHLTFLSVAAIIATAFPLIENLRRIGEWRPSSETPFPPDVPGWLKSFCEMLYWRETVWRIEAKQNVWSAALFKAPYGRWLDAKNLQPVARYLFEGVLVSLIVQLWLLPVATLYFHRVSPAAVWLNLWVGLLLALESFAAVIALAFAQISEHLALPVLKLTEIFNYLLLWMPRLFVANDWASFAVPAYTGAWRALYFAYFLPVLLLTLRCNAWRPFALISAEKRSKRSFGRSAAMFSGWPATILLLLLIGTIVFHPFSRPPADGRLRVDFLDVGQGDAALITFPNGETMLVDGGGQPSFNRYPVKREDEEREIFEPDAFSIGEAVVSRFLWEKGYSRIDYILATHADADHMQGLVDVAENFAPRAAFFGRTPAADEDFARLSDVLRRKGIPSVKLARGDVLRFGGASVEVLFPFADDSPEAAADNNHSLVLRLGWGTKKFLLTGDIEKETESFLAAAPEFLSADVVKVAHHGSRTSSTESFVAATRAVYAVISVGRRSPYGHPHQEVVERWKSYDAEVLQTGERGLISVSTDGSDLKIERFRPESTKINTEF